MAATDAIIGAQKHFRKAKKKTFHIIVTAVSVVIGLVWVAITPASYQASAVLAPAGDDNRPALGGVGQLSAALGVSLNPNNLSGGFGHFQELLTSVNLARIVDKKYHVGDMLGIPRDNIQNGFASEIKVGIKRMLRIPSQPQPRSEILYNAISNGLGVTPNLQTQTITVTFSAKNPQLATRVLTILIKEADGILKQRAAYRAQKEIKYISEQLRTIGEPNLREILYPSVMTSESKLLMAKSDLPYSVQLLDEPFTSIKPNWPRPRWQVLVIVVIFQIIFFSIIGYKYLLPGNSIFRTDEDKRE